MRKLGNRRLAAVWLGACLLSLHGCELPRSSSIPPEDRLLDDLMEEYVNARFRFYPVESTLAGLPGNDARLGSFSSTDVQRRMAWLWDFSQKLGGLKWTELSKPAYLDALWLTSLVQAELTELQDQRLWQRSPAFYGEWIRAGVLSLVLRESPESHLDALIGRLQAVPPLLSQADVNLVDVSPVFQRAGVRSLENCRGLLRALPELLLERVWCKKVAEVWNRWRCRKHQRDLGGEAAEPRRTSGGAQSRRRRRTPMVPSLE